MLEKQVAVSIDSEIASPMVAFKAVAPKKSLVSLVLSCSPFSEGCGTSE